MIEYHEPPTHGEDSMTDSPKIDRPHAFAVGDEIRHVDSSDPIEVIEQTWRIRDGRAYPTYTLAADDGREELTDILCTRDLVAYDDQTADFTLAIADRFQQGLPPVGPLTREQHEQVEAYERYCEESQREHDAQEAAGGRTICPVCERRTVVHKTICTLGYAGHPGADYSDYGRCENCGHEEL